jgi:ABC-type transport system involved in multi-copper enzyme maturation permease subunit
LLRRDIRIITEFEYGRLFRSPHGLLFLAFLLVAYGWLAKVLFGLSGELQTLGVLGANSDVSADNPVMTLISYWIGGDEVERLWGLVTDHPPVMVGYFVVALALTALFAMLAAMDQTASDISSRHLRFLLLRTDRASIYVGKTLATYLFFGTAMGVVTLVVIFVVLASGGSPGFTTGDIVGYALRIYVTVMLYALPFVTFVGLCSAMVGHAMIAAVVAFGTWLFLAVASGIGALAIREMGHLSLLFPTAFKYHLVFDDASRVLPALLHQLILGAVFFMAGLTLFRRRDV